MNDFRKSIPIPPAQAISDAEVGLFEIRKKIYPRAVTGWFANASWTMVFVTQIVFYGLPWLAWNDRQAVLFDIAARRFYLFGAVFWPQDVIYLAVLLIIAALSLFLFTAMAGRLWCGFACPQTVYTQIFLWVERRIEGGIEVDRRTGELHMLVRRAHPAPSSALNHAIRSVDVESLLTIPFLGAACPCVCSRRAEFVLVRENIWLDQHRALNVL